MSDTAVTAETRKMENDLREIFIVLNILLLEEHIIEIIVGINVVVFILVW
jgi:hypothetical protein